MGRAESRSLTCSPQVDIRDVHAETGLWSAVLSVKAARCKSPGKIALLLVRWKENAPDWSFLQYISWKQHESYARAVIDLAPDETVGSYSISHALCTCAEDLVQSVPPRPVALPAER